MNTFLPYHHREPRSMSAILILSKSVSAAPQKAAARIVQKSEKYLKCLNHGRRYKKVVSATDA